MGEMADWINDNGFWADMMGEDLQEPSPVRCRNCGADGFHWDKSLDNGKWGLYDTMGALHHCPVRPLQDDRTSHCKGDGHGD